MLRLLPYVIICLVLVILARVSDVTDQLIIRFFAPYTKTVHLGVHQAPLISAENSAPDDSKRLFDSNGELLNREQDRTEDQVLDKRATQLPPHAVNANRVADFGEELRCNEAVAELSKHLKHRRSVLEQKENELNLNSNLMKGIEQHIDSKLSMLATMRDELQAAMEQYKAQHESGIAGLAKTYESMKPRDAAKLFNTLQMAVLLQVARQMKEVRLGQVLSQMDPEKAKELTVALTNQGQFNHQNNALTGVESQSDVAKSNGS